MSEQSGGRLADGFPLLRRFKAPLTLALGG